MPELPEVETIMRGLQPRLVGQRVRDCILNRPDMRFPFPDHLQEVIIGATIQDVFRRAKYLLFQLDSGVTLIGHLGMSGAMRVVPADDYEPRKHDHVLWELENNQLFAFHDPRRFGFLLLSETDSLVEHPMLASLGPEPLGEDFTANYLQNALSKRGSALKVALMDQKVVVGVGNIYASEALFRAGLNPFMKANQLLDSASLLVPAIQSVLQEAIESGGSTLRDYVRSDGDSGYFQHHFAVYGRENEPCITCGAPVQQVRLGGRSTYFCIDCQRVEGNSE